MLRLRLAFLALATGLLCTLSGCASSSYQEEGRLFPRLFNHSAMSGGAMHGECECQQMSQHPSMDYAVQGPVLTPGQTVPIPITNMPGNQPPKVFNVPTAPAVPYVPAN